MAGEWVGGFADRRIRQRVPADGLCDKCGAWRGQMHAPGCSKETCPVCRCKTCAGCAAKLRAPQAAGPPDPPK